MTDRPIPEVSDQPAAYQARFGNPTGGCAVFDGPAGDPIAIFIYEDDEGWIYASHGVAAIGGAEWSMRLPKEDGDPRPGQLAPALIRDVLNTCASLGTQPTHGHVELVHFEEGPRHLLFVWDPEIEGAEDAFLRIVIATDAEGDLAADVDPDALSDALMAAMPGLPSVRDRGDALDDEARKALKADHPRTGPVQVRLPVAQWTDERAAGGQLEVLVSEAVSESLRSLVASGAHGRAVEARGPDRAVVFWVGETAIELDGDRLSLTLPAEQLQRIALPWVVEGEGVTIRCCAMAVTPTPPNPATSTVSPPSRRMPRMHHYSFTYKYLPSNLDTLRLHAPGSTTRLVQGWAHIGKLVAGSDLGGPGAERMPNDTMAFLQPTGRGRVPGTEVEGIVGLGVVSVSEIAGWRVAIAQMPLPEGPTEAFYMAIVDRDGVYRLLSWELGVDGLARLGEWWVVGDDYDHVTADFGGAPHVAMFREAIQRWLTEHPTRPPGEQAVSQAPTRPGRPPHPAPAPMAGPPTASNPNWGAFLGLAGLGLVVVAAALWFVLTQL